MLGRAGRGRRGLTLAKKSTFFTGGSVGFFTSKAMRFLMGTMTWLNSWDDYRMAAPAADA